MTDTCPQRPMIYISKKIPNFYILVKPFKCSLLLFGMQLNEIGPPFTTSDLPLCSANSSGKIPSFSSEEISSVFCLHFQASKLAQPP